MHLPAGGGGVVPRRLSRLGSQSIIETAASANISPEQRSAALRKAAVVRQERAVLLDDLKQGNITLAKVLASDSETVTRLRVQRLLEALPGVGKIRASQLMNELDVPESRRVQGLGPRQRQRLLAKFPPA